MRTAILVILLTATAASAIAMRLNPLAVSTMVGDRRPPQHATYVPMPPVAPQREVTFMGWPDFTQGRDIRDFTTASMMTRAQ
jgi:hypothetical protein